jgi:hypothetical protein
MISPFVAPSGMARCSWISNSGASLTSCQTARWIRWWTGYAVIPTSVLSAGIAGANMRQQPPLALLMPSKSLTDFTYSSTQAKPLSAF